MSAACCAADEPDTPDADSVDEGARSLWRAREIQLAAAAGAAVTIGFTLTRSGTDAAGAAVYITGAVLGGTTFVPDAVRALTRRRLGVGTLMTIALLGALALQQFAEAAALAFLFSISEALEERSLARARRGLRALLDLVPPHATVLRGSTQTSVLATELAVGDILLVRAGERVASDGTVQAGRSWLDNAAITGESVPVETGPGDTVYAGAVNGTGVLNVEVTAAVADNSLSRVVRIVEEAQRRKGFRQRVADRVARPLVPSVITLAAAVAALGSLFGDPQVWLERALIVLVAAAPCALAISVPVTVVAAVGAASRTGVLIKGGAALEVLGSVRAVALDKTGTLTRNRPVLTDVVPTVGATRSQVLAVGAALEARSEHPLAAAVLDAATTTPDADNVDTVPGQGLTGLVDGNPVRVGRPGWIDVSELAGDVRRLQERGVTVAAVDANGRLLGVLGIRDEIRPEARDAVDQMHRAGLALHMLTGDNTRTARAVAIDAGIVDVHAELHPTDKAAIVERLRTEGGRRRIVVAMVGDGINDAPALATADVGIAMGAMGTDVAIETADVALMGSDLRQLPLALTHARRARRIMLQNIALSLTIVATLVPLAALGVLGLATVVLIHELAEVFVIGNGVRAGRLRTIAGTAHASGQDYPRSTVKSTPAVSSPTGSDSATTGECSCCPPDGEAAAVHSVAFKPLLTFSVRKP